MRRYAIVLGKNPELSIAELRAFSKRFRLGIRILEEHLSGPNTSWVLIKAKEEIERYFRWLGGSLKLVWIIGNGEDAIEHLEYARLFTLSLYGNNDWRVWRKLGSKVKEILKRKDRTKFFKPANVYAMPGELLLKGFPETKDFVFFFRDGDILVGETVRITDPFELKKLDVERPVVRPILSIPPRLARIMVNLAEVRRGNVLDPFCGIGTILQELILQGLNAYGSDRNPERIREARRNLEWLRREFRVRKVAQLEICDVRRLRKCFRTRFDAIVTEPYMGKPLRRTSTKEEAVKMARELDRLYYGAFESFADVLKRNARVVFVFPAYRLEGGGMYRRNRPWLEELGFEVLERHLDFEERHRLIRDIHVMKFKG
ncbi:TRM11 family SAM-dependent methyltransferase [Pyrococcus yayanosii]|uniref:RNA methylase, putative n=1 Tax=Pyrococcus yayanosii (strain CH1 / JCM 16557) TaxID=529709 RepID=F8AEQ2_PYRYC|nr:TRM11 family methyltransferase [Pyrococcus yayanosii]AEH24734.1 RNA methylase, putative [Pyrococcus yayanosii CH1]